MVKSEYDVIIIGAGISGLSSAALLSKHGLSCLVLEKQPVIGGYLQGFKRGAFIFDTSIHWLNQCGPDGMVTRVFRLIGEDYPQVESMSKIHRFKSEGLDYLLTNNPDELKAQLIQNFPHERKGIEKFFRVAKKIGIASKKFSTLMRTTESMSVLERLQKGLKTFRTIIPMIPYALYSGDKAVKKGLNLFFKDPKLHQLFSSETDLLSCLFPIAWAYNNDYQMPIKGGGQSFPKWLKEKTEAYGGAIELKATVSKIETENQKVTGVRYIQNGEEKHIKSKYVISAVDLETLYREWIPQSTQTGLFVEKLQQAELYYSGATVSIALDCPARDIGIFDELTSITRHDIARSEHSKGDPLKSAISIISPSERDSSLSPTNQGTLNIYIPAEISYNDYWQAERDEHGQLIRGERYKKHKEEFAQQLIKRVETSLNIDIRSHILFYDVSTPITYWRYTGNKNGTIMGARPGKKNMQLKIAQYKTPIENLWVSGHWAELGGGVPIAVKAAFNASLLLLQKENKPLFDQMCLYIDGKADISVVD